MGRISSDFIRTLCGGLFLAALSPMAASAPEQVGVLECHLSGNGITVLIRIRRSTAPTKMRWRAANPSITSAN